MYNLNMNGRSVFGWGKIIIFKIFVQFKLTKVPAIFQLGEGGEIYRSVF